MDGQDIWVSEFTNSFCLTKKAARKIFLHLCVRIGTRQKDFNGNLLLCRGFLGQEYCAGSPITQQFFKDARAEHLTNKMMSPGCGHAEILSNPSLREQASTIPGIELQQYKKSLL